MLASNSLAIGSQMWPKDRCVYVSSGVDGLGSFSVFLAESTILVAQRGN